MKLVNLLRGNLRAKAMRLTLAAALAAASGGTSVALAGSALAAAHEAIWVCKFIGPPGAEVLKEGKQPIRTANPSADELVELFDDRHPSYVVGSEDAECDPVPKVADLQILKERSPASVVEGGSITYTLTVSNAGDAAASTGFQVTDLLESGQTLSSVADNHPGLACVAGPPVTCTFSGSFGVGDVAIVTIVAAVPADHGAGAISNTGKVTTLAGTVLDESTVSTGARARTCQERGDCPAPPPVTCEQRGDCPPPPPQVSCVDRGDCPAPPPVTCEQRGDCPPPPPVVDPPVVDAPVVDAPSEALPADGVGNAPTAGVVDAPATGQQPTEVPTTGQDSTEEPAEEPSARSAPISGQDEEPATAAERPDSQPRTSIRTVTRTTTATPRTLPFTGSSTATLLALAGGLYVVGLALALAGRRRRTAV